jgi:hypothetical protein
MENTTTNLIKIEDRQEDLPTSSKVSGVEEAASLERLSKLKNSNHFFEIQPNGTGYGMDHTRFQRWM